LREGDFGREGETCDSLGDLWGREWGEDICFISVVFFI
jgi:hypothetical protein